MKGQNIMGNKSEIVYGKNGKMLNGGKLAGNRQMDRRFLLIKIWPFGGVCLCPGAISVYITIIFKPLLL